jgi:hypothetical protein
MYILRDYPAKEELLSSVKNPNRIHEVNGHVHTPYSFSAFADIAQIFEMAKKENVKIVGINDFYVTDGQQPFYEEAVKNKVFPMFNMESICLMKEEQKQNIRVNDPNNPGRCYFTAKGLNYPFSLNPDLKKKLDAVIAETQVQVKAMVKKCNEWLDSCMSGIKLDFDDIKKKLAKDLVRERHIAKAIRIAIWEKTKTDADRIALLKQIYGGKDSKTGISNIPALENEIRGMLLKAGGLAFVAEDENAFMSLEDVIRMYLDAGAIPCYPVLLDDPKGKCTEFETDYGNLHSELTKRGIGCIELIPGRNDLKILTDFVRFFNSKNFVILLGTEHNAPEMMPLTCDTRGNVPLTEELRKIGYEGACVVAAHQYLKAKGQEGFVFPCGHIKNDQKADFIKLGHAVIEKWIN